MSTVGSSPLSGGRLLSVEAASALIEAGHCLSIAGDEALLRKLPRGVWVGGTIPYFMAHEGGRTTKDKVFVSVLPQIAARPSVMTYDRRRLGSVCTDAPDHGFTLVILPAFSDIHADFARNAPDYEDNFVKPLIGWISGIHLDDLGVASPMVVNGDTLEFHTDCAVAVHVPLALDFSAEIDIVNLFTQGNGDRIHFKDSGFSAKLCTINGKPARIGDYVRGNQIDTQLPLVANYHGALINASIQSVHPTDGSIQLYGPVFPDVEYRFASPVSDYVSSFRQQLPRERKPVSFACNCVLNYLYCGLEGQSMPDMLGPMTFGEVAYQLLNQTLVYLRVEPIVRTR